MIAAQMAFTYVAFMNEAFHSGRSTLPRGCRERRRIGRVAACRLREMGPRPRRKKPRSRPEHPAAATAKSTMRTTTPQKLERVHDIFRERRPALETMLTPKSVAVIGATEAEGSVGRTLMENLKAGNFGGEIIPVNLKRARVLGIPAVPKVGKVEHPIDLAVIVTPAATVPGIIGECVDAGAKGAIIISAGFRECGAEGVELEKQVLTQARRGRMRIIGPNCLGVMRPHAGLNATFAASMALPGSVGFISQSGALCTAILDWSLRENVGFSAFVSVGSMLDVNWGDLIYYLGDDPHTRSIIVYMESIGDARSFLSAAREVALTKPIIVIKVGRTAPAAKAAASHTGSLTGSDEVLDAAFRRVGRTPREYDRRAIRHGRGARQTAAPARSAPCHRHERRWSCGACDRYADLHGWADCPTFTRIV